MLKKLLPSIMGSFFFLTAGFSVHEGSYSIPVQSTIDVPLFYHVAANIFPNDRIVQFEDESCWKIAESDMRDVVFSWREGDFLVVTLNREWWNRDHTYCIANQANGSWVRANIISGPLHNSPYTHHVSAMEINTPYKKVIHLDGRTSWSISSDDFNIVNNWQVGDTIIILSNDRSSPLRWFSSYDVYLLDVETNTTALARRM